jgi:hypothetical protein
MIDFLSVIIFHRLKALYRTFFTLIIQNQAFNALVKKYLNADKNFGWRYVFAGRNMAIDPRTNVEHRYRVTSQQ